MKTDLSDRATARDPDVGKGKMTLKNTDSLRFHTASVYIGLPLGRPGARQVAGRAPLRKKGEKLALTIKVVANKGPKAIQAAVETAAKAAKRRDSYAKKLQALGVELKD